MHRYLEGNPSGRTVLVGLDAVKRPDVSLFSPDLAVSPESVGIGDIGSYQAQPGVLARKEFGDAYAFLELNGEAAFTSPPVKFWVHPLEAGLVGGPLALEIVRPVEPQLSAEVVTGLFDGRFDCRVTLFY